MKTKSFLLMASFHLSLGYLLSVTLVGVLAAEKEAMNALDEETREWVDPKKVLELGDKKDRSSIAYLRKIRARKDKHKNSAAYNAQMALAKLGEAREMEEIVVESKASDPEKQAEAIEKLAYIANQTAVLTLVSMLDDPGKYRRGLWIGPDGKQRHGDVIYEPPSIQACRALMKVISDGPKAKKKFLDKDDVSAWKEWWKKNRKKYE